MTTLAQPAVIGIACLMLAACGSPPPPEQPASSTAAAVPTSAVPPATSVAPTFAQIGEPITNIPTLTYTVTSIDVDGSCPGPPIPTTNGHLLLVGLDVQTTPQFSAQNARGILSPYGAPGWSIIGPDGITQTGLTSSATYICADSQIPQTFSPGQRYAYKLAFDTKNTTGTIQYQVESVISRWKY